MTNLSRTIKPVMLLFGVLFLLLLTGCGANLATQIDLDGAKFSGSRVMSVTFDVDELNTKLPGGVADLNDLIDTAIPKQLNYKYEVQDNEAVYQFTLNFDSKQDYIDKLKNLLNKAPEVTFTYSTGVFTRGVVYNENFESRELFLWLDKVITENRLVTASQNYSSEKFWNQTGVKINLDGEEYTCEGGQVNIQSGGQSVVSALTISTQLKASGDIERSLLITIPNSVEKSQMNLIEGYLNDNTPDSGTWSKRTRSNSIIYTVNFTAGSPAKLQTYMEKLTMKQTEASLENVQDLSQPLAQSNVLSEALDFSYFGGESNVPVTYEVSTEVGTPYQINLNDGEQEKNADAVYDGSKLVCSGSFGAVKFKTTLRKMASVDCIDYNLIQTGNNKFIREIVITLTDGTDPSILDNISEYYKVKGAGNTKISIENESAPAVKIYVTGSPKQLVAAEAVLFGGVGARSLRYERNWGVYTFHPKTTLADSFDITSLITLMNVSSYIYTYSHDGNIITQITTTVDGDQDSKELKGKDDVIGFGLSNGIQSITIEGYYFNGWAVFFTVMTVLLLLALITMAVLLYLYKTGKIQIPDRFRKQEPAPMPEPEPLYNPIPMAPPVMPDPEPEPMPLPTPEPRDLTASFDEEEEPPVMLFTPPEPEPEPIPEPEPLPEPEPEYIPLPPSTEPNMDPVISYPEKYHPTDEFVNLEKEPEPEPEPIPEPEPPKREIPYDYTDEDMIEDLDSLGLLGEYARRIHKVKVKVRKMRVEYDDENYEE